MTEGVSNVDRAMSHIETQFALTDDERLDLATRLCPAAAVPESIPYLPPSATDIHDADIEPGREDDPDFDDLGDEDDHPNTANDPPQTHTLPPTHDETNSRDKYDQL